MPDRKRTKWVQGGIVGEPVHADVALALNLLVGELIGAEKFGMPADFDIERMWREVPSRQHTRCLVCGEMWIEHFNWDCKTKRRRS